MPFYTLPSKGQIVGVTEADDATGLPPGSTPLPNYAGIPPRPSPSHLLSVLNGALIWADPRTLAQARLDRVAAMRDAREAAINAGFVWSASPFDSDEKSQSRLLALVISAQLPGFVPREWRLANNTYRTLTAANASAVYMAFDAHVQAQFARFVARETAITNAPTIAAVEAVTWE